MYPTIAGNATKAEDAGSAPAVENGVVTPADGGTPEVSPVPPQTPNEPGAEPEGGEGKVSVKEIIKLRKRAQEAELEVARLRGVAEGKGSLIAPVSLEPTQKPPAMVGVGEEPKPPDMNSFESYEDYEKAKDKFIEDHAIWAVRKQYTEHEERERSRKLNEGWSQQVAKAVEKHDDFITVISNPAFGQSDVVASLIKESEIGADLAYYLGKNLEEANRINFLPPHLAAREIGRIEAKLLNPTPEPPPEPRKVVSLAPEPVVPVAARGEVEVEEQELSTEDFIARRNAREQARRRGQTL